MGGQKNMAKFTADRFTHQDTSEYGQGKKVTTKILETDAKNTEYLLGELEETRQQIPATLTRTYAPLGNIPQWSTNTEQTTITEQDITSNNGKTYHVMGQKIWRISGNNTTAHLETEHFITPGPITQIIAPAITTGTTQCQKSVLTTETTLTYEILGTLTAITGNQNGTVQPDSLIQQYYDEINPATQPNTFTTYNDFLDWLTEENMTQPTPFHYWLSLKEQKTIYGLPSNGELPLIWKPEWMESIKINNTTISEYTVHKNTSSIQIPTLATLPTSYTGGDTLKVRGKYLAQTHITTDTINLSYNNTVIDVQDTPENNELQHALDFLPEPDALQIFKNNTELIQGIDYTYNMTTLTLTIHNTKEGDYIEIIRSITGLPQNIQLFYDITREDTQSNVVILPVQVRYTPTGE